MSEAVPTIPCSAAPVLWVNNPSTMVRDTPMNTTDSGHTTHAYTRCEYASRYKSVNDPSLLRIQELTWTVVTVFICGTTMGGVVIPLWRENPDKRVVNLFPQQIGGEVCSIRLPLYSFFRVLVVITNPTTSARSICQATSPKVIVPNTLLEPLRRLPGSCGRFSIYEKTFVSLQF